MQKMELALANEDAVDLPLYLNALNTYVGLKKQVTSCAACCARRPRPTR